MTIAAAADNRKTYTGNGATTSFSYNYAFTAQADLVVLSNGATMVLNSDYTISGSVDSVGRYLSGANVVFAVAPAASVPVVIYADPTVQQTLDLVANDPLPAESVEKGLDVLTLMVRRLKSLVSRSLTLSDADTTTASTTLPTPDPSGLIGWNASGTALANYSPTNLNLTLVSAFIATLLDDANAAAARTTLGAYGSGDSPSFSTVTLTGGQIAFPATQNASAGANTLDDYEEGTWTPSVGGTATYNSRVGRYTKIGRMVFTTGFLDISAIGTGTTGVFTGLPFASANIACDQPGSVGFFSGSALTVASLGVAIANNSSQAVLYSVSVAGAPAVAPVYFNNNATLRFSIAYEAA